MDVLMENKPTHPPRLTTLDFTLVEAGWLTCTLPAPRHTLELVGSYLTNIVADFIAAAYSLLTDEARVACCILHREPEGSVVVLTATDDGLTVLVSSSSPPFTEVMMSDVPTLASLVADAARRLNPTTFELTWGVPFPQSQLDALEHELRRQGRAKPTHE